MSMMRPTSMTNGSNNPQGHTASEAIACLQYVANMIDEDIEMAESDTDGINEDEKTLDEMDMCEDSDDIEGDDNSTLRALHEVVKRSEVAPTHEIAKPDESEIGDGGGSVNMENTPRQKNEKYPTTPYMRQNDDQDDELSDESDDDMSGCTESDEQCDNEYPTHNMVYVNKHTGLQADSENEQRDCRVECNESNDTSQQAEMNEQSDKEECQQSVISVDILSETHEEAQQNNHGENYGNDQKVTQERQKMGCTQKYHFNDTPEQRSKPHDEIDYDPNKTRTPSGTPHSAERRTCDRCTRTPPGGPEPREIYANDLEGSEAQQPIGRDYRGDKRDSVEMDSYADHQGCGDATDDAARHIRSHNPATRPVPVEKPTATSDRVPTNTYNPPILLTIRIGEFIAEIDIANCINMAGRDRYPQDPKYDRERDERKSDECDECSRRMNGQDRRIGELEDSVTDKMRKLRVQNEELADELREVKRKMNSNDTGRPNVIAPVRHDVCETRCMSLDMLTDPVRDGERLERQRRRPEENEAQWARLRAASFAGVPTDRGVGARPKTALSNQPQRRVQIVDDGGAGNAAKPQRPRERKGASGRQDGSDGKVRDNPIKEWLHTARRDNTTAQDTPKTSRYTYEAERSPSWADVDGEEDDETDTSNATTPNKSPMAAAEARDPTPPPTNGAKQTKRNDEKYDDIYKLPPSGQVTERRNRQRENNNGTTGAEATRAGAVSKQRGKTQGVVDKTLNNVLNDKKGSKGSNTNRVRNQKGKDDKTYSKVVTNNGWKTVPAKKRKFDNVSPKPTMPLKGIATTVNRDVYLQGLDVGECSDEELIESVRSYCIERGITPTYIRIIPVRYDYTRAGCRLTVRESDFNMVIRNNFWPDEIRAREWKPKPRENNENEGRGPRAPSDEED